MSDLHEIAGRFRIGGTIRSIVPFGTGHINDSFLVTLLPDDRPGYLLQRINHHIFNDIPALSQNIFRVTTHLKQKLAGGRYEGFRVTELVPTDQGSLYTLDEDGAYWRLLTFIDGSRSYDRIADPSMAREAGKAFALFQYLASDLPGESLAEVLPGFHHVQLRLDKLREVIRTDRAGRVAACRDEILFTEERSEEMHRVQQLLDWGEVPLRVTHNDTKINNVLFNEQGEAFSVVDLDTVMPGTILFDFGDAIRTGAATAEEDEEDLSRMAIDLSLFEGYAGGYLSIAKHFLNETEINNLAFSAKMMTYIIGLRFLTDHLDGDRYYKIVFPGHNLRRARAQFQLLRSMETNYQAMQEIIRKLP